MNVSYVYYSNFSFPKQKISEQTNLIKSFVNTMDTVSLTNTKDISIVGKNYKNKIKVIFTDIDGTISPKSDIVSQNVIQTVEKLYQRGIPVILTTARTYDDTLPIINQFIHKPEYTIVLQGGEIVDKNGKKLTQNSISKEDAKTLIDWAGKYHSKDKNTHIITYFMDRPFSTSEIQFPWSARCLIEKVDNYDSLLNSSNLQKCVIYQTNITDGVEKSFKENVSENLAIKPSGAGFYEVQNASVSKDEAIKDILNRLNLSPQNTIALGDSSNDLEMLNYIKENGGLAIAMGNANQIVKDTCSAITSGVNEDGFCKAVQTVFEDIG